MPVSTITSQGRPLPRSRQRAGVDAEHRKLVILPIGAEIVVDEALVPVQRPGEAANHVVEWDVVIAGHRERLKAASLEPVEERGGFPILRDPRTLGEVAADHHQIGAACEQEGFDRGHDSRIVMPEMNVGQVRNGGQYILPGKLPCERICRPNGCRL